VGARTDAARAQVVAARDDFADEVVRLEAAGRAAVDIPSKVKRAPAKTAGLAAGAAFLIAGGPKRLFRRAKRAVMGPEQELPPSMLPDEVDKALRKLGPDGDRVRGTLEREFAKYLDEHREERENRDLGAVAAILLANVAKPLTERAGRRLAQELFSPDRAGFQDAVARIRARRDPDDSVPTDPLPPSTNGRRPRR
jgi:cytidylate kinase